MIDRIKLLDIATSRVTHAVSHILLNLPIISSRNILRHSKKLILFLSEVPTDDERSKDKSVVVFRDI